MIKYRRMKMCIKMKAFIILLYVYVTFLCYYCSSTENFSYISINDNALEVERLIYGDITSMKHMFLPPLEDIESESEEIPEEKEKEIDRNFEYINVKQTTEDIKEFNDITRILNNSTRRYNGKFHGWDDPQGVRWWHILMWRQETSEPIKKEKLVDINIMWLIHARYQIKKAIMMKHEIRVDKRYRIGYLFNRLRRIKYEQQKLANIARQQDKSWFSSLHSQIKLYEKMVRYDVDITDTIKYIREIDKERVPNVHLQAITKALP